MDIQPTISEKSKTSAVQVRRFKPLFQRKNITLLMETSHDRDMIRYVLECNGCDSLCNIAFFSQKKLSFAFVAKLDGVFCSLCRGLDVVRRSNLPGGLLDPEFDVDLDKMRYF